MAIRDVATFSIEQPLYTWLLIAACFFGGLWGIDTVGRLEDPVPELTRHLLVLLIQTFAVVGVLTQPYLVSPPCFDLGKPIRIGQRLAG